MLLHLLVFMEIQNFMGILVIMELLDRQISTTVVIDPSIKAKTFNNQGQKYYNPKLVIHDFSPGILGSPSQFHDGGSSYAVICHKVEVTSFPRQAMA